MSLGHKIRIPLKNELQNLISELKFGNSTPLNVNNGTLVLDPISRTIGINNINPIYSLDVSGSAKFTTIVDVSNSPGTSGQVLVSTGNGFIWSEGASSSQIDISTSNTNQNFYLTFVPDISGKNNIFVDNNALVFNPNSNSLGIGLSSPSYNLDVSGNTYMSGQIVASNGLGLNGQVLSLNAIGKMEWRDISGSGGGTATSIEVNDISNNQNYYITFVKDTSGGNNLYIDSNSFVINPGTNRIGLNNLNPSYKFDVSTNDLSGMRIGTALLVDASNNIVTVSGRLQSTILLDSTNSSGNTNLFLKSTPSGLQWSSLGVTSSQWTSDTSGNIYFPSSQTDISKLGIGTITPTYKLDISNRDVSAMRVGTALLVDASNNIVTVSGRLQSTILLDSTNSSGNTNLYLRSTPSGLLWSSLGVTSSQWTSDTSGNIYFPNSLTDLSNVGIGVINPTFKLDVSGETNIRTTNVRIGRNAGEFSQKTSSIGIGVEAGYNNQGTSSIAIGVQAGREGQDISAIAIGYRAGFTSQRSGAIAIGSSAGLGTQGREAIAIGVEAGQSLQGQQAIAIGWGAGQYSQGLQAISVGLYAGQYSQGQESIAIGKQAGNITQSLNSIAIGNGAGFSNQGSDSIALGSQAGACNQDFRAIAIGYGAGKNSQGIDCIAIGESAGTSNQNSGAISIGYAAGDISQQTYAIAIGGGAGSNSQQQESIAIGRVAGNSNQGTRAIAIGYYAGTISQAANSIILHASTDASLNTSNSGLYVAPVRSSSSTSYPLVYDLSSKEIAYNSTANVETFSVPINTVTATLDVSLGLSYFFPFPTSGAGAAGPLNTLSAMSSATSYSPLQYSFIAPTNCILKGGYGYFQVGSSDAVSPTDVSATFSIARISSDVSLSTFSPTLITDVSTGNFITPGASTTTSSRATRFIFPSTSSTTINAGDLVFLLGTIAGSGATKVNYPTLTGTLLFRRV